MTAESLAMLERHGMQVSDIDLFIAHQANLRIIEAVGSVLALPRTRYSSMCRITPILRRLPCLLPWMTRVVRDG